jgi:hypothetical protein
MLLLNAGAYQNEASIENVWQNCGTAPYAALHPR